MKVMEDGGKKYIADSKNAPSTPRPRPAASRPPVKRTGFFQKLFAKCWPRDKKSTDQSPDAAQDEPSSQLLPPPPPYSAVTTLLPHIAYYPGQAVTGDTQTWPEELKSAYATRLPFDAGSFGALKPMHPSMPFHLAFYHLDEARRRLEWQGRPSNQPVSLPSYICSGEVHTTRSSHNYTWSSEMYFWRTFLQKQEISYRVDARGTTNAEDMTITMCPHQTISLVNLRVEKDEDGGLKASARLSYQPARYRGDRGLAWNSITSGGQLAQILICRHCHCDLEQSLEIRGRDLHVRFTAYRDLGHGVDRFDPKWTSLLTGKGVVQQRPAKWYFNQEKGKLFRQDRPGTYSVYRAVWAVAYRLGRPGLHVVTFPTAHGDFTGLSLIEQHEAKKKEKEKK
ncbi:hypothetical protein PG991_012218 [Apiospora marii]|uniref:Uncharacterized protein n=2 Tax=Apiospora marii TaxID=335849 RepID=A0ABR1RA05_9PEZI